MANFGGQLKSSGFKLLTDPSAKFSVFNPNFFKQKIDKLVIAHTEATAKKIRQAIGVQGPPRSQPGQPPKKDSGRLFRSIKAVHDSRSSRIESDCPYGRYVDEGTKRMRARPFWRIASEANTLWAKSLPFLLKRV